MPSSVSLRSCTRQSEMRDRRHVLYPLHAYRGTAFRVPFRSRCVMSEASHEQIPWIAGVATASCCSSPSRTGTAVCSCVPEHVEAECRHGAMQGGGVHGNAILSRFDMSDCRAIEHRCGIFHNRDARQTSPFIPFAPAHLPWLLSLSLQIPHQCQGCVTPTSHGSPCWPPAD